MKSFKNVDEYIGSFPKNVQSVLKEIRKTIHSVVPKQTEEKISYGIPTFTLNGNLVHFGGFKNHVSLFPGSAPISVFKKDLAKYELSKGTIKFSLDRPVPFPLIKKIVKFCVKRNQDKIKRK